MKVENGYNAYETIAEWVIADDSKRGGAHWAFIVLVRTGNCIEAELFSKLPGGSVMWDMDWADGETDIELLEYVPLDCVFDPAREGFVKC